MIKSFVFIKQGMDQTRPYLGIMPLFKSRPYLQLQSGYASINRIEKDRSSFAHFTFHNSKIRTKIRYQNELWPRRYGDGDIE